jgi:putative ABC transport system substrate-binding protein
MPVSRLRLARRAVLAATLALALASAMHTAGAAEQVFVAVTAIVDHPALEACRDGIRDELKAAGYEDGKNLKFVYESAKGSTSNAIQIAQKFVGQKPDVIVAISTPSAQAVVAATQDIPVVFTAVTDPVGARVINDRNQPGGNVTGVSDMSPIHQQLELIRGIMPNARIIGVPYNPGETNSMALLQRLELEAHGQGMVIHEVAVAKSADVSAAARRMVGNVDAIYVPTDNTVVSALAAVTKVGMESKLPVFAGDTEAVLHGAVAAVGFNYYDVGRQTGKIVLRVLNGENPGDIAVEGIRTTELYVNPGAAEKTGISIPAAIIARAKQVVK